MRDNVLVQAQRQLDGLAATMAQAMSSTTVNGTTIPGGYQVDTARPAERQPDQPDLHRPALLRHPAQHLDRPRVDDPSALPLSNDATDDPNDEVIGVDFSGGLASVASQLSTLLPGLTFSDAGSTLQVVDDGGVTTTLNGLSATKTETTLQNGDAALPMFVDGNTSYTGAITGSGSQPDGFAGRISVNTQLAANPAALVLFDTTTQTGDPTRPNFIYDQLTSTSFNFSPSTGMGSAATPYSGSLTDYLKQVLAQQGRRRPTPRAWPRAGHGGECAPAARQRRIGRQCRPGNGEPDHVADRLRRQCPSHVGDQGHARHAHENVR